MTRKRASRSEAGTPYTAAEEAALIAAIDSGLARYDAIPGDAQPTMLDIQARVEWKGYVQTSRGGMRNITFRKLDLSKVKAEVDKVRKAGTLPGGEKPASSYTAKGWHAQLAALTKTKRGVGLADRAGLSPTSKTLRAWVSESSEPSKANRDKIAQAYSGFGGNIASARRDLVDALTAEIKDKEEGSPIVRFRDIQYLDFM
jgi:hypothetical protein